MGFPPRKLANCGPQPSILSPAPTGAGMAQVTLWRPVSTATVIGIGCERPSARKTIGGGSDCDCKRGNGTACGLTLPARPVRWPGQICGGERGNWVNCRRAGFGRNSESFAAPQPPISCAKLRTVLYSVGCRPEPAVQINHRERLLLTRAVIGDVRPSGGTRPYSRRSWVQIRFPIPAIHSLRRRARVNDLHWGISAVPQRRVERQNLPRADIRRLPDGTVEQQRLLGRLLSGSSWSRTVQSYRPAIDSRQSVVHRIRCVSRWIIAREAPS